MNIRVEQTGLDGVLVIHTDAFRDERGFFLESYHRRRFADHGISADFVQDNHSRSKYGVLRGLHFQDETAPMGKLIRCIEGRIFDVAVDLRVSSPTFGRWYGTELTAENMLQLWIPSGYAHGFVTLSDFAQVLYKCAGYYAPSAEGTITWNDPDIAIDWPLRDPILSHRDQNGVSLEEYARNPAFR